MDGDRYVSTGDLPAPGVVQALVDEAHARLRTDTAGAPSDVYPALAAVPPDLFGLCVVSTRGTRFAAGDADHAFTIMSVSKPFAFALVCERLGPEAMRERIGVNGTGLPFNSLTAIERSADGRTNPMVNAGAIATTSLVSGATLEDRWRTLQDGLSALRGADAGPRRRRPGLRPRDQRPQPGDRAAAGQLRPPLRRSGRGGRRSTRASARSASPRPTSPSWAPRWPTAASTQSPASASSRRASATTPSR